MRKLPSLSELLLPAVALAASTMTFGAGMELAVVVNKSTAVSTISTSELRQMMLGEKTKWSDGKKVLTVETAPDSPEKALLLKAVIKMNDSMLKRYQMHAAFTGQELSPPKEVGSSGALKEFVARTPGAIGCILAADVDDTVTVIKVDGAAPGEPAYKLH
jgi:ABC-type phosphate transport system substrate-binding protein